MKHVHMKKKSSYFLAFICFIIHAETSTNATAVQLANIDPDNGGSIMDSGRYYLGWDLPNGALSIGSDRVTIDLNGHTVRQINISGHTDVTIINGVLDGSTVGGGSVLAVSNSNNVHISDLAVINSGKDVAGYANGISISGSTNVFLLNCLVQDNSSAGCRIESPINSQIFISDCTFNNNGLASSMTDPDGRVGLLINGAHSIIEVRRCLFTENHDDGVTLRAGATQVYFFDCISDNNGNDITGGNGFQGSAINQEGCNFTLLNCQASSNNESGILSGLSDTFYIQNYVGELNGLAGFKNQTNQPGLVRECIAANNIGCGFNDTQQTNTNVVYISNFSYNNNNDNTNYCIINCTDSGAPYFPVTRDGNNTQYWRNIKVNDCP